MPRVVLRRSSDDATSVAEAAAIVAAQQGGSVIDRGEKTMLVDIAHQDAVGALRSSLRGWIVSEQGARIRVPDTRLKIRSDG